MQSYSLNKYNHQQSCPATLHNSTEVSFEQLSRKYSMADINPRIDIDQVMIDIKLTPLKNNEFIEKVKTIYHCLEFLKKMCPSLLQEVRTAELIIENIESKWKKDTAKKTRVDNKNERQETKPLSKEDIKISTNKKLEDYLQTKNKPNIHCSSHYDISPIKQLDETTSRIVYTNFSIKEIQNSCKKQLSHKKPTSERKSTGGKVSQKRSIINQSQSTKQILFGPVSKNYNMHKKQNSTFTVSIFEAEDGQMQRLTKNIQALDRVLEQKGLRFQNDFTKGKSSKAALKEVTLNTSKPSSFKSERKPTIFNSKQKITASKQIF